MYWLRFRRDEGDLGMANTRSKELRSRAQAPNSGDEGGELVTKADHDRRL